MNKTKNFCGFTFIEIIIAIAVMSIMFLVGYPLLNSSKNENKLKAAQREVTATIKSAHSYALQGKTTGGENPSLPAYWGFRFVDERTFQIFSAATKSGQGVEREEYSLNNGVKLTTCSGSACKDDTKILFKVPHGEVTLPEDARNFTLTLGGFSDGSTKEISINNRGAIEEK